MSTDTGYCNESFALDATTSRHCGAEYTNAWVNSNQNYTADQVNDNRTDEKPDLLENDLRMKLNENEKQNSIENKKILSPTPSTALEA